MNSSEVRQLTTEKLSVYCAEQTILFHKTGQSDGRYCYELLRRAAIGENDAWEWVYAQYVPEIKNRIARRNVDPSEIEDLTHNVLERFRRNVLNLDRWPKFPDLGYVLSFLYDCTESVVLDYYRWSNKQQKIMEYLKQENLTVRQSDKDWSSDELRAEILRCVRHHYRHENDDFLVEQLCGFSRKPQEVAKLYPEKFSTAAQVSQQKRNLVDRIARDPECAMLFKML